MRYAVANIWFTNIVSNLPERTRLVVIAGMCARALPVYKEDEMASLAMADPVESSSGRASVFDLGPGAHECWYPVALSSSVPKGTAIGRDIGDGRIVVYRGED